MEYKLSSFLFSDSMVRDDKHLIIQKINQLRSFCPSDSTFSGEFKLINNQFTGFLKIQFARGQFEGQIEANSSDQLMKGLRKQIQQQVEAWREVRFQNNQKYTHFNKLIASR